MHVHGVVQVGGGDAASSADLGSLESSAFQMLEAIVCLALRIGTRFCEHAASCQHRATSMASLQAQLWVRAISRQFAVSAQRQRGCPNGRDGAKILPKTHA
jgi:hypothetical protein